MRPAARAGLPISSTGRPSSRVAAFDPGGVRLRSVSPPGICPPFSASRACADRTAAPVWEAVRACFRFASVGLSVCRCAGSSGAGPRSAGSVRLSRPSAVRARAARHRAGCSTATPDCPPGSPASVPLPCRCLSRGHRTGGPAPLGRPGHPAPDPMISSPTGSSPHPRGCSAPPFRIAGGWLFVPVPAGVACTGRGWSPCIWCRPRARGGCSIPRRGPGRGVESSPCLRGRVGISRPSAGGSLRRHGAPVARGPSPRRRRLSCRASLLPFSEENVVAWDLSRELAAVGGARSFREWNGRFDRR